MHKKFSSSGYDDNLLYNTEFNKFLPFGGAKIHGQL